jgi:hypothetical protein
LPLGYVAGGRGLIIRNADSGGHDAGLSGSV